MHNRFWVTEFSCYTVCPCPLRCRDIHNKNKKGKPRGSFRIINLITFTKPIAGIYRYSYDITRRHETRLSKLVGFLWSEQFVFTVSFIFRGA